MIGLTRQQAKLLRFIRRFIGEHGYAPSFDEMTEAMGLSSKSGIDRILNALQERRLVRRLYGRARSVEIIEAPPIPVLIRGQRYLFIPKTCAA